MLCCDTVVCAVVQARARGSCESKVRMLVCVGIVCEYTIVTVGV
jgi:hypothetical protein